MAELLKRDHDIVVLKVEANVAAAHSPAREPQVRFTLQYHEHGTLADGPTWEFASAGFLPAAPDRGTLRGAGPHIELPADMLNGLLGWFKDCTDGTRPLWVHLVKPYGLLRLVAWERELGRALGVPILMLPDFLFPPPREALQTLDVVLCGSAPLGHEGHSVHQALAQAAHAVLAGCTPSRRVHLHVFADADIAKPLADRWKSEGRLGDSITVYDAQHAAPYVQEDLSSRLVDRTGALRSPWLLWMRQALSGRGVDVVHFVCHGWLSRERGALLFAQSPLERTDRYLAGPVGAMELGSFLTQTGAWSTVFTALPDNHSDPGLRWLADEVAQSRPGPMMMHTLREDPGGAALAAGYAFVYGLQPQPAPHSTALFLYCQPYLLPAAGPAPHVDVVPSAPGAPRFARPAMPGYDDTPGGAGGAGAEAAPESSAPAEPASTSMPAPKSAPPPALASHPRAAAAIGSPFAAAVRNQLQHQAAMRPLAGSPLDRFFSAGAAVSSVVASTERFAEQVQLRVQQLVRDEAGPDEQCSAQMQATFDTLDKLRAAVADIESRPSPAGGPP